MNRSLFSLIFLLFSVASFAQIEFGIKAGLSSYDLANEGFLINDGDKQVEWNISNAGYGHHFGIYTRLSLLGVYLEPALLFNSNRVTYDITEYSESGVFTKVKNEKYNQLDIPVMAGIKLGVLRFQGGVVGHLFINNISDVVDFKGYDQRFKTGSYGWQAGVGLDIWKLRMDLNFEGNLDKFGDHITINGQDYAFEDRPSRLLLTLGYKF
ncbi:MAG TPA: outer membrane beta-barrel protein [Saprospiraceae bacterium]|jgi:hypothetical protein|nr:outer membrane beta-barrel protein [Saprospiraceae bacterium]HMU05934.1 outer membrane beta-barrel protein [Saprospiraceae bacterium]